MFLNHITWTHFTRRTRTLLGVVGCGLIVGLASGCTANTRGADDALSYEEDPEERLIQYRAALRSLSNHPYADQASSELARAQSWLESLQNRNVDLDDDDERSLFELKLRAIKGELVKVRSFYSRREAEAALESARADFQERSETAQTLRRRRRGN